MRGAPLSPWLTYPKSLQPPLSLTTRLTCSWLSSETSSRFDTRIEGRMPRSPDVCSACRSPHRNEIDEGIARGEGLAAVGAQAKLSRHVIRRHRDAGHVAAVALARLEAEPDAPPDPLAQLVELQGASLAVL